MVVLERAGSLTNTLIDEWSSDAETAYYNVAGKRAERSPKMRLSIEEILLRFRDYYGTDTECCLKVIKSWNGIRIEISQKGPQYNPLDIDEKIALSYDLMSRMGLNPDYSWKGRQGINCVSIPFPLKKRKNSMLIQIVIALVLAVVTGIAANAAGSNSLEPVIALLFGKLSAIFAALATPLVFCAVISGISGIGSAASFGKLGSKLIGRMLLTYGIAIVVMVVPGLFMGLATTHSDSSGSNVATQLLNLVLDMIPNNLVEPFRVDNDLQVIVLAIFVGFVMLLLGERVQRVTNFISEIGDVINKMMLLVCKLLPLFVYLGVTDLILTGQLQNMPQVSIILLLCLIGSAITIGIVLIRTRIVTKLPFRSIVLPQVSSLLINLSTSSQISALPESMRCCKEKYKIDEKFVDFGLPLGIVVYMPNGAIMLGAMTWVLAVMSNGAADPMTIFKIMFVAVVVAIAAPPIPGSAFAIMPILFSASGTDLTLMPLAVIVASTFGYLLPAMNGFCLQLELLMTASKHNMIYKEKR